MSAHRASTTLQRVLAQPRFEEREPLGEEESLDALAWQGTVLLVADRASGLPAAERQQQVRTGLLERALVLGADHREGPHLERPEAGRRLLAHLDALAEAGFSNADLELLAEEGDLDRPGALWALTILRGCIDDGAPEEAFEAWLASLDEALFLDYRAVDEIAEALRIQPSPALRAQAQRWALGPSAPLRAVALEGMSTEALPGDLLLRLSKDDSPLVRVALERFHARVSGEASRSGLARRSWVDIAVPALAYEAARARVLQREGEPLSRLRQRDAAALAALGPHALDLLALAGEDLDRELASELVRALPSTPPLLDAMGRAGFPSLLPRLLADIVKEDLEDDAHAALSTMLGPRVAAPSREGWEQVAAALPGAARTARLRGGEARSREAILAEMRRPELSERALRLRGDELLVMTGKQISLDWGAFGISLERALSELGRLAR